jgi:serine/threonine protein kinase
MKLRKGRLNVIEFVNKKIIRKIGIVREESRPHRLKTEAWALSQARLKGVNTPEVLDYYQDSEGREVLELERIYGKHLSLCTSQDNADSLQKVGFQMSLLNNISTNYGFINPRYMIGESENWKSFISLYVRKYGTLLVREKILTKNSLCKVYKAVEEIDLNISTPYLVNRDIKPSNIIRDDNGKIWIVDWENVILGDPLYDVAIFGVKYGHGILWKNLVEGYKLDISSPKYMLYEIIGLIGIIDFYQKNQIRYYGRVKQLCNLIRQLDQSR